jgi:uncharacterized protein YbbC (DUF1343 family)
MNPTVSSGLEELLHSMLDSYRGARAGIICNPASVNSQYSHALDLLASCPHVRLTTGFGPQHGARQDKQDNMIESEDFRDPRLGIPIYSLYGTYRKPTAEMLADLDVLFCDLVDVGVRIYTFMYTMALAMEACAETGKRFVVLDRPNPIGGRDCEGNILDPCFRSFVGLYPIPMRHGMTLGELALLFNKEFGIGADLDVIQVRGWRREQWLDQTGLPWVMPSPNMPTLDTAAVYPGMVLIEGTMLSEGRGTTRPFEYVGAPYIDPYQFAEYLNASKLPGAHFRPVYFRPTFQKWQDQLCGGIQIHVLDRDVFQPFLAGLAVLKASLELYPGKFQWRQPPYEYEHEKLPIDILLGTNAIRKQLEAGWSLMEIQESWMAELNRFRLIRKGYLLYD